jgi:hypothetical protein
MLRKELGAMQKSAKIDFANLTSSSESNSERRILNIVFKTIEFLKLVAKLEARASC